jgi:lipid A oxidase
MGLLKALVCALALGGSGLALAESEFALYSGVQGSPHSTVTNFNGTKDFFSWQGQSLKMPIYAGWRYTEWLDDQWGVALNFTHVKDYANLPDAVNVKYDTLEFTDGANPITLIALRRFEPTASGLKPYVGVGAGITMPHVEELRIGSPQTDKTFGYQYGGPAVTALAGFKYPINDKWDLMTEFQVHYMMFDVRVAGGRLKTNLISNAINIGAVYRF